MRKLWLIVDPQGHVLQWFGIPMGRFYWWPRSGQADQGLAVYFTRWKASGALNAIIATGGADQSYHQRCRVVGIRWRDPNTFRLSDKQEACALQAEIAEAIAIKPTGAQMKKLIATSALGLMLATAAMAQGGIDRHGSGVPKSTAQIIPYKRGATQFSWVSVLELLLSRFM